MLINSFDAFRAFENQLLKNNPDYIQKKKVEGFTPSINSREVDDAYLLDVDVPGIAKEDIKLDVKDKALILSGERHMKEQTQKEDYFNFEIGFGKFSRHFSLPDDADIENIEATCDSGVLSVNIPKLEEVNNQYSVTIN